MDIAHLNELPKAISIYSREFRTNSRSCIARAATPISVIRRFQFERLSELGFNICLGTDSLASNHDLSLFAEMREFHNRFPQFSRKNLEMVTINPASALERRDELGKIRANFLADLIALPFSESASIFETILNFVGKVPWIMLHGEIT